MTPSRRLLWLLSALMLLALAAALYPALDTPWMVLGGLVLGVSVVDGLQCWQVPPITVSRDLPRSLPVGIWSRVGLTLVNTGNRSLQIRVHDHHPGGFQVEAMPRRLDLPAVRSARLEYRIRPEQRGDAEFAGCDLVLASPLGLWRRRHFRSLVDRVKVFPNFQEIGRYSLLATDHRLSQMGVKRHQRRGEGNDFYQLREYRSGDALRQIDWKASSRYRRLISREYQDERDQQVLFLLDCGRRMRHADDGREHLDQALNALLLLAHVAARQGDAVGLLTFGGSRRWLPPYKGSGVVKQLLSQTYDLAASDEAADFPVAARELMSLQKRRALIVILTNTRDEDHADLLAAISLLKRRHLVVVANLRESLLDETLALPVRDIDAALRFHSIHDYLERRRRAFERLRHQGAITLDLLAPQLPVALVNGYLTVKASGAL